VKPKDMLASILSVLGKQSEEDLSFLDTDAQANYVSGYQTEFSKL